ncbi:MAG: outer membrane lipoprotein carrier protein LolA [Candidatus Marinimicrobia bacterium]|nr:outer membrane lipoprotein carrier protein LolA [Candidatus Neomarinimicrobiota bacterium]
MRFLFTGKLSITSMAFLLSLNAPQLSFGQSAKEVMDKMRDVLRKQKEISISYEQSFSWKSSSSVSKSFGKLDMKNLKKLRLQTDEQTLVTDGDLIWTYSSFTNQVVINKIDKSGGTIFPSDFLFEYPKDYNSKLVDENKFKGEYLILLTPKNRSSFVTAIRIWLDDKDFLIRSIEYKDINGNVTLWEVTEMDIEPNFGDSHFDFETPPGAEVVDLR